ncbi:MAG: peptidase domain-containing ABC transporter [Nostoc sp. SerVER01]|uniref:peptidase domain-containing ABC transporter n=1 Tax=Nostoc sp. CCY 9925 TaxID=3103865 RepID=UPI002AD61635|nr:peptidase domain-containing ABC transporter [Nostoc sp. SerVER01]MDZ8027919.1 peptidase domain-containing ABC transporter [Nostoc sp. DedQUE11]MDZ8074673.1 peptidase domain-containing ABC transporter [Nostoc sp. DedQUE01]MDZ8081865.1 peptidase domain-containing ABC transporter [Nostoc sp. DcaGUA01]MDZ8242240.1 peptidase domain-containing ABC transporter [Nostoc sp. ChiQUE01a]
MASRENSKTDSQTTSELKILDNESLRLEVLASLPWNQPPLCWLTPEQQLRLQDESQARQYRLGDKIWSSDIGGYQFLIVAGKVRLRDGRANPSSGLSQERVGKSIAALDAGDWFGDLQKLSADFKAVAASKEVIVLSWETALWAEFSHPQIQEFWQALPVEREPQKETFSFSPTVPLPPAAEGTLPLQTQKGLPAANQIVPNYPFVASWNTAAACLTMVAQQLENSVQLEWVQRQLRGQRPKNVVEAAEKMGLMLRRLQVSWGDLRQISFPALLLWNSDLPQSPSWVVAYGVRGDRLIIANPLNPDHACESLPQSVIEACWDGQLWQVELISQQEQFNLSWFTPAVWKYKGLLGEVLLASFTLQLLGLTTPLITQVVIDKVMVQESLPTLDVMAIALLFVAIFESILGILRLFIFTHTARRLDLSLSAQLFRHLMRLPLAYFESRRVGDTVARVQELEQIRQFLTGTALTVILDSIFAVVYLALMFYYNIPLTFVALAVLPLFATLTIVATPILRNWLNETFNRSADSQSFLVETITGIHSVKAHAAEPVARDRWEGLFARFIRTGFKASTTSNISSNIGDFLTNFSTMLILWFGAKLVIEQKLTVGQLVAFQMLSGRVTGPLLRLVQLWQNLQQVLLSVDRIGDILNVSPEAEQGTGLVLPPLKGQVSFDQVFFRYRPNFEPVLRGISFNADPGQFVGIVGRSGSGKSTLSKLLQRLYQIESGRILIDGFDIKSADLASLRQQISVVLQEDFLFNGSILDNITLGNPDISAEQVVEAARLAVAHDFISQLPYGYETNVGERGTALSGGQRQRIALARLFLSQAPILVLDEATSALDSETEQQVLQNLQKISANRTVFLIAHRFAPLKRADLILVLEQGVIAERGTHLQLLQQKGLYWSLYQRQQANI